MKKIILLLALVTFSFSGCEKDDICDANTPTTPRLVIEFYDITNPAVLKNVTNLKVTGLGMDTPIVFNETATTDALKYRTNANKISLPLRINGDNTQYTFELNSGNANPALIVTDILDFNYTRKTEYVSRACGFKTTFTLNSQSNISSPPVVLNNSNAEFGNWIKNIQILESNIETENEVHIKIFF